MGATYPRVELTSLRSENRQRKNVDSGKGCSYRNPRVKQSPQAGYAFVRFYKRRSL